MPFSLILDCKGHPQAGYLQLQLMSHAGACIAVKRRRKRQTLCLRKEKMAALLKRQYDIQVSPSVVVSSSYSPSLCKGWSSGSLKQQKDNNKKIRLKILGSVQLGLLATML